MKNRLKEIIAEYKEKQLEEGKEVTVTEIAKDLFYDHYDNDPKIKSTGDQLTRQLRDRLNYLCRDTNKEFKVTFMERLYKRHGFEPNWVFGIDKEEEDLLILQTVSREHFPWWIIEKICNKFDVTPNDLYGFENKTVPLG